MKNKNVFRRAGAAPILLLLLALLLRLLYVALLPDKLIWSDERDYYRLSQSIQQGHGFVLSDGHPTAVRPAGYPFLLAVLGWCGVRSLAAIRMAQTVIGTLTLGFLYLILCLFSERKWALVTLALGAMYPYFIYQTGALLATGWFCFLIVVAVYFLCRAVYLDELFSCLASGAVFGLAGLAVPTGMILFGLTFFWLLIMRRPWQRVLLFMAAGLLVVTPWIYRNYLQTGVLNVSSTGGYNFWLGNNPHARINLPGSVEPSPDLSRRLARAASEGEIDRLFTLEAFHFIYQHPGHFVKQTVKKAVYYWRLTPSPATGSYVRQEKIVNWLGAVSFSLLLLFAIWGGSRLPDSIKPLGLLWFFYFTGFTLVHSLTIVKIRFRLPLEYFLLMLSAYGVLLFYDRVLRFRFHQPSHGLWHSAFNEFKTDADWSQLSHERERLA